MLDKHRKAVGAALEVHLLKPPFSFFDFVEERFGEVDSIRRVSSLARSSSAQSLIYEKIYPEGIIAEENGEILHLFPDYQNPALVRISFWKREVGATDINDLNNDDLTGYALFKHDVCPAKNIDRWHVFEAVFLKYPHAHNCVPHPQTYCLTVGSHQSFAIQGVLYCQQNGLNKACAQVALRSLLSRIVPEGDISYRRLNEIAASMDPGFDPGNGLGVPQVRKILSELKIEFQDIDYTTSGKQMQQDLPYQKFVYAGMEAGAGALVGFRLAGQALQQEARHIIPIYGHTFNKDTWAPDAEVAYFKIGESVGYVPSESWTSSFLAHDDNFGPNFCIPRLYIGRDKVDYIVEIFKPGVRYSGVQAEALALDILYSLFSDLATTDNRWIERLTQWTKLQRVVFRAQSLSGHEYVRHLRQVVDWEGNREDPAICDVLRDEMPKMVWAVEISTPQLFPANERKLGDIVLDATRRPVIDTDSHAGVVFLLARLPGMYLLGGDMSDSSPQFTPIPSLLRSHVDLIRFS